MRSVGLLSMATLYPPIGVKKRAVLPGDLNLIKVPSDMSDNQVLFLSDILATGWHATELGNVHDGDSVAIWGCGPGQCLLLTCLYFCLSSISLMSQMSQSHTRSTTIASMCVSNSKAHKFNVAGQHRLLKRSCVPFVTQFCSDDLVGCWCCSGNFGCTVCTHSRCPARYHD